MEKYRIDSCNKYGLEIEQNTEDVFTIRNRAGETFIAEFYNNNTILLRHYNYKAERGGTHRQGSFNSIPAMLANVYSHGNRFFKPQNKTRIDMLFAQIEGR